MCVDLEDTLVVAAMCRALVETAAAERHAVWSGAQMPTSLLRLAVWSERATTASAECSSTRCVTTDPALDGSSGRISLMPVHDSLIGFTDVERLEVGMNRVTQVAGTSATCRLRAHLCRGRLAGSSTSSSRSGDQRVDPNLSAGPTSARRVALSEPGLPPRCYKRWGDKHSEGRHECHGVAALHSHGSRSGPGCHRKWSPR